MTHRFDAFFQLFIDYMITTSRFFFFLILEIICNNLLSSFLMEKNEFVSFLSHGLCIAIHFVAFCPKICFIDVVMVKVCTCNVNKINNQLSILEYRYMI